MFTTVSLGSHNGSRLVADFFCSDLCPTYTVRVIHYDLPDRKTCHEVGGVERAVAVPVGIGSVDHQFCFPTVLIDNWSRYRMR